MKSFLFTLSYIFIASCAHAQGMIYEVPLKERIVQSDFIFEGKVLSKESFWNKEHNNIYTLNQIEVYKIFKGNVRPETVTVVTPGGMVDDKMILVDPSLKLSSSKIGLFFVKPSAGEFDTRGIYYDPFAAQQSFIEYDLVTRTAADPFKVYKNIPKCLYKVIRKKTKQSYIEIKLFDINQQPRSAE